MSGAAPRVEDIHCRVRGQGPTVHLSAFIADVDLIGDVTVEEGASVWSCAVLRADFGPIVVRNGANVQDGSVLHTPEHLTCDRRGRHHPPLLHVHGATIGEEALIGNGTLLDGSVVGARTLVAAGSVVTGGSPAAYWRSVHAPGSRVRSRATTGALGRRDPQVYRDLAQRHRTGVQQI